MERMSANGCFFHRSCFRCTHCNCQLKIGGYSLSKGESGEKGKFFCTAHYRQLFMSNPEAIGYQRADAKDAKRESRSSSSELNEVAQSKEPSPTDNVEAEKDAKKKAKSKKKSVKESKSEKKEASSEGGDKDKKKEVEGGDSEKKKKKKESKKKQKKPEVSEEEPIMIIEPPAVVKDEVEDSPRARSASMVKTLSQGFEQLEKHAKTTEIQPGTEGR